MNHFLIANHFCNWFNLFGKISPWNLKPKSLIVKRYIESSEMDITVITMLINLKCFYTTDRGEVHSIYIIDIWVFENAIISNIFLTENVVVFKSQVSSPKFIRKIQSNSQSSWCFHYSKL